MIRMLLKLGKLVEIGAEYTPHIYLSGQWVEMSDDDYLNFIGMTYVYDYWKLDSGEYKMNSEDFEYFVQISEMFNCSQDIIQKLVDLGLYEYERIFMKEFISCGQDDYNTMLAYAKSFMDDLRDEWRIIANLTDDNLMDYYSVLYDTTGHDERMQALTF